VKAEDFSGDSEDVPPSGQVSFGPETSLEGAAGEGQGDTGEVRRQDGDLGSEEDERLAASLYS